MKYPAILRNILGNQTVLAVNAKLFVHMSGEFELEDSESYSFDSHYTNITKEYLSNTWGIVESKEHAEFIIELAELHGLGFYDDDECRMFFTFNEDSRLFFYSTEDDLNKNRCKQITIPLPPKNEINEAGHNLVFAASECKEWPCVNDEVTWGNKVCNGVVKAIDGNLAWIKNDHGNYVTEYVNELQKPKTPEEALRDDVSTYLCDKYKFIFKAEAMEILESLLTKYNITPKD